MTTNQPMHLMHPRHEALKARFPAMLCGLEMEYEQPYQDRQEVNHLLALRKLNLELGTDLSTKGEGGPKRPYWKPNTGMTRRIAISGDGYEFRTKEPWVYFPGEEVKFVVQHIRSNGWVNRKCGIHYHVSGVPLNLDEYTYFLEILQKQKDGIWLSRASYCPFPSTPGFQTAHHSAVQVREMAIPKPIHHRNGYGETFFVEHSKEPEVTNRIEVRIFNMSPTFRGIHQSWVRVVNALYKTKIEHENKAMLA